MSSVGRQRHDGLCGIPCNLRAKRGGFVTRRRALPSSVGLPETMSEGFTDLPQVWESGPEGPEFYITVGKQLTAGN